MSTNEESSQLPTDDKQIPVQNRLRSNSYDQAISSDILQVNNPLPESDSKLSKTQPENDNNEIYIIKWIEFNQERLPILLQNINGPCPLLAIANILLLRKQLSINPNTGDISTSRVIQGIANHLLKIDPTKLSKEDQANYEQNFSDALNILPKLKTGIDVNLKFNEVDQFEYTKELTLFDLLNIQLFHGWIIDPQNTELLKIIGPNASSYNQLVEKMIHQKQSNSDELVKESLSIEQFLDENRSQLTHYGIFRLNQTMRENQLAVFFRNNHFNTIWKMNGQLLLLVSDQGFIDHPSIVFETLTDIDNNSVFTDGYGRKWQKPSPVDTSHDRDLAIAVHNNERRQYSQAQQRYDQQYYRQNSKNSKQKYKQSPSYEKDSCILS